MSRGVLLVNLGSPDSPSVRDVRRYLREFLMDERVLDVNWLARFCLVNFVILPFRPKHSAHAYQSIWTKAGSPLVVTGRNVRSALRQRTGLPVELAMRYRNPSIADAIRRLVEQGIDEALLIPLFPHYAMSSYETAVERTREIAAAIAPRLRIIVQPPYFDDPDYIGALAASAGESLRPGYDHLLFSFHGVPERQIRKSDPTGCHCLKAARCCDVASPAHATCYRSQCFKTANAFARTAGVSTAKYSVAFQSRLGRDPWLAPSTDHELERLVANGVKRLVVICPSFVSDCLETIEEIGLRGRETFLRAGGTSFTLIPCLNEHPLWIAALEKMVGRFLEGKASTSGAKSEEVHQEKPLRRRTSAVGAASL